MELAINWDDENNKDGIRPEAVSFQLVDGRYSYAAQMNDEGVTNSNLWTKKLTFSIQLIVFIIVIFAYSILYRKSFKEVFFSNAYLLLVYLCLIVFIYFILPKLWRYLGL